MMKMNEVPREGVYTALWIPTDFEGHVMKQALADHLTWLRSRGVDGVLALGSTGEFPHFDVDERKMLFELIAELAAPLPVIANISDFRPRVVAELGAFVRRLGLPAVSLMAPGFYPISQSDLLSFFLRGAETAGLPVFLYNFRELTGVSIALETVAAFADGAPMAGVKQSGADFDFHKPLIELGREKDFVVFTGADMRLPEAFALGATGCIGGMSNFVPELKLAVYNICRGGGAGDYRIPAQRLIEVGAIINQLTFPLNVAAAMESRGLSPGVPKTIVSGESARIFREVVATLGAKIDEWGLESMATPDVPAGAE